MPDDEIMILIYRYFGAALALGLGSFGSAVGMGMAGGMAAQSMMRQPNQDRYILRTMLIGQAMAGNPSIFALVIGLLILYAPMNWGTAGVFGASLIGAGLAIGLSCFGSGLGCGWPASSSCESVARNPRRVTPVTTWMVISQAIAQSPAIFGVVVSLILIYLPMDEVGWAAWGIALGAGIAMGAAGLGPGIGSGYVGRGALSGVGRWPRSQAPTIRLMQVAQAVAQTPAIFGLLIAFIMLFALGAVENSIIESARLLGAGIAVGVGGIGPGIGSGFPGDAGCTATAAKPRHEPLFLRTVLIGQAISQSTAIYGLVVALLLLYVI